MAEKHAASAEFGEIWKAALVEFHANTKISLANDSQLLHLQNIDEVIDYLAKEHVKYDKDTASSQFTSVVKDSLGPLKFFLNTGGKAAGDVGLTFDLQIYLRCD
jgi:hypothetical protein